MQELDLREVETFVNENIGVFHRQKLNSLEKLDLKDLLRRKNPYLFRARNFRVANALIEALLDAYLSSSEEKLFGDFLEGLAIFIAGKTLGGVKSSATGIDLEFDLAHTRYIVSIKSGTNWGNSSQQRKQREDFSAAMRVLKQSHHTLSVQPVLGICYGRTRTTYLHNFMKVVGQNFWYLISGNRDLYTDIIEPIGYRAREHNAHFLDEKDHVINRFTQAFAADFCVNGVIQWDALVAFNSGNFDLDGLEF